MHGSVRARVTDDQGLQAAGQDPPCSVTHLPSVALRGRRVRRRLPPPKSPSQFSPDPLHRCGCGVVRLTYTPRGERGAVVVYLRVMGFAWSKGAALTLLWAPCLGHAVLRRGAHAVLGWGWFLLATGSAGGGAAEGWGWACLCARRGTGW